MLKTNSPRTIIAILLIPVLLIAGLYISPLALHAVHAAPAGEVCMAENGSISCPLAPPLFNSTFPGPQLRVALVINNSQPFNVFDVTILTDHTILKPAGVDLTGSLLSSGGVALECLGGVLIVGPTCSITDTRDTLHLAVVSGSLTDQNPTSGLLFTAIFNVTGKTNVTSIGFATGCGSGTSVPQGVCITVVDGAARPSLPEIPQGAKYSNQAYFDFQPEFENSLTVDLGGTDNSLFLNVTSINDFQGTVNIATLISPLGPTAVPSPSILTISLSNPQNYSIITVHVPPTTAPGSYNLTFAASSGSLPPNSLSIPLFVPAKDFGIALEPNTLRFNVSSEGISTITVSSLGNFSGVVSLALRTPPGVTASLSRSNLNTPEGKSNSSTVTVRATTAGSYALNITGTAGLLTHTLRLVVNVLDFAITAYPQSLTIPQGTKVIETLEFTSATTMPYNVTIRIIQISIDEVTSSGTSIPSNGISVSCNPIEVALFLNAFSEQKLASSDCEINGVQIGNYTVTVTAASGSVVHSVAFKVQVPGPGFSLASPDCRAPGCVLQQGSKLTTLLGLMSEGGFSANVTLTATVSPNGLELVLNPATVQVTSTASSILTISSGSSPAGNYTITLTGISGSIAHSVTIIVIVTPVPQPPPPLPFFAMASNPSHLTITQGSVATSSVTLATFYNFAGTFGISAATIAPGLKAILSTQTSPSITIVALGPNGTDFFTLTVIANSNIAGGDYQVILRASSGPILSQTLTVQVHVIGPAPPPPIVAHVFMAPGNLSDITRTSGIVTFAVNISNTPPINLFTVSIHYSRAILRVDSVNSTGNILGDGASILYYCVDGVNRFNGNGPCLTLGGNPVDGPGVVTYAEYLSGTLSQPTKNGFLFHITFRIVGSGVAQLHMLYVQLDNGTSTAVPSISTDGYFVNSYCGTNVCKPPSLDIAPSTLILTAGDLTTFNATAVLNYPNDAVLNYTWSFGSFSEIGNNYATTQVPWVQHVYESGGNYIASVEIIDKYNVSWISSILVKVGAATLASSIIVQPSSLTIQRGSSGTLDMIATAQPGLTGSVEVGAASYMNGLIVMLSNSSMSFGTANTLQITVGNATQLGTYYILVGFRNENGDNDVVGIAVIITVTRPPLMVECGRDASCLVQSNVTISGFRLSGDTVHLTADEATVVMGQVNMTIPVSAIPLIAKLKIFIDNIELPISSVEITLDPSHRNYLVNFTFIFPP